MALAGLLVATLSCGGEDTTTPLPPNPNALVPVRITLDPAEVTLVADDTVRVRARAFNDRAQVISDAEVTWTSGDPTIAAVDAAGLVAGLKEGSARLAVTSGFAMTTARATVQSVDRATLMDLYDATGGAKWASRGNWGSDAPIGSWHGVEANAQSRVTALRLSGNGLNGRLPETLGRLAFLAELRLEGNERLYGPIPLSLSELDLRTLHAAGTVLCAVRDEEFRAWLDAIPARDGELIACREERSDLGKLYEAMGGSNWLNSSNWLTDAPLDTWHGITVDRITGHVTGIRLGRNNLSGEIPPEIRFFRHLRVLNLSNNRIRGEIPTALGELARLLQLSVEGNMFTGEIPPEIGKLEQLEHLTLGRNQITGPIPRELGRINSLHAFDVRNNRLSGPLPPELGRIRALRFLVLKDNRDLSGPLPAEWTELRLITLAAGGTGLCAPRTPGFSDWLNSVYRQRIRLCGSEGQAEVYLTQAVQSREHPVPLVAGKGALLRVFVTSERETTEAIPPVRATFFVDGTEVHSVDLPAGSSAIPTEVREGELGLSANAWISGAVIQPSLEMVVEVDPDGTVDAALGVSKRIPAEGRMAVDVKAAPTLLLTLVPFVPTVSGHRGAEEFVAEAHPEHRLLWPTNHLLPVGALEIRKHASVTVDKNSLYAVLVNTARIRTLEGGRGHWLGLIPRGPDRVLGIAYTGSKVAASILNGEVIAHELGHNFLLPHAPCGGAGGPDGSYPYPNGRTGVWGYDPRGDGRLVPPNHADLMSYCGPKWISDHFFSAALRFRLNDPGELWPAAAVSRTLVVSGGVDVGGAPHLDPAFVVTGPAVLPNSSGPYRLTGSRADGSELFSYSFGTAEIADGDGRSGFAFALPVRAEWESELASLVLAGPGGSVEMREGSEPPMAILRDPRTGEVRAIFRDLPAGPLARSAAEARAPEPGLDVLVSTGLPRAEDWRRR